MATVKILDVQRNASNSSYQDLQIEIIELFKGEPIKTQKRFDNLQLQNELERVLKQYIRFHRADQSRTIPEKAALVIGIYYYPSEESASGFVSTFYL